MIPFSVKSENVVIISFPPPPKFPKNWTSFISHASLISLRANVPLPSVHAIQVKKTVNGRNVALNLAHPFGDNRNPGPDTSFLFSLEGSRKSNKIFKIWFSHRERGLCLWFGFLGIFRSDLMDVARTWRGEIFGFCERSSCPARTWTLCKLRFKYSSL